ncbi:MAG TPA: glycosyltransferase family 2 protein [Candidatus Omnitrophota bacterium]|nr:glycosyltransferase family 2 protein [Candidatus Omnitrophota bacterium]HPS36683.1 glycosyltransferase family 2 protein [Candidatus Omnitrophota bacterium]
MKFIYSRQGLKGKEEFVQRVFEILPGLTSWTLVLGLIGLSFWQPLVSAIFVIIFLLAWIMRLFYMTLFLVLSYLRLSLEKGTDWLARARGLDRLDLYREELAKADRGKKWLSRLILNSHLRDLEMLKTRGKVPPLSSDIRHLVVVPVIKESEAVIEANIASIAKNTPLTRQIVVAIALESRAADEVKEGVRRVVAKYRGEFLDLLLVEHPEGLPGEARVKGANATFAAKAAAEYFRGKGVPFENVVVSCFDTDTVVRPDYFACLTYSFMACPDRHRASFQPVPVFHNNIWEVPGFARVVETGSSFFQLIETTDPEKLVTFSSHSMSFQALVEMGYWPVDMISDDSGIFWKAYLYFEGQYRVVPMPMTLSMDVVDAGTWWRTVVSLYKQKRRWAWGVENFPLVMRGFLQSKKISLYNKIRHGFKLFEGHVTWAALPFLLTLVGWLPAIFPSEEFSNTVLYYSANRFTQAIFGLSSLALAGTIGMSIWLLPKKQKKYPLLWTLVHGLEWFLVPVILVFLSAMPALDAQTRLMFNRRMEFWVSDKRRQG